MTLFHINISLKNIYQSTESKYDFNTQINPLIRKLSFGHLCICGTAAKEKKYRTDVAQLNCIISKHDKVLLDRL